MLINVVTRAIRLMTAVNGSAMNMPLNAVERCVKRGIVSTNDTNSPITDSQAVIVFRFFGMKASIRNRMHAPSDSESAGSAAQIFRSGEFIVRPLVKRRCSGLEPSEQARISVGYRRPARRSYPSPQRMYVDTGR